MSANKRRMLPKNAAEITNGSIYPQQIRCGKPNCKCVRGELHTAHYFFTRKNGKLTKTYIRKSRLLAFDEIVFQARQERKRKREAKKSSRELEQIMRTISRLFDKYIECLKGEQINEES